MTVAWGSTRCLAALSRDLIAARGISAGDWIPAVLGILAIVVAVVIAWRQRIIQLRDRAADRAVQREREEAARREQAERDARIARREVWRAEYEAIRELLERGEVISYRIRNDGPFTREQLVDLGTATFVMNAEQLAERGIPVLREPLLRLADLVGQLVVAAVPHEPTLADTDGRAAYPDHSRARDGQRRAVAQDRIARKLNNQISDAWQMLRTEWGG